MKKLILFALLAPFALHSKNNLVGYKASKTDFTFELPSEDVYFSVKEDFQKYYSHTELFYNEDEDFVLGIAELIPSEYLSKIDYDEFLKEYASDYDYENSYPFYEVEIKPGVNSKYYIAYDADMESMEIFGIVHDRVSRKIYEIELSLYTIDVYTGAMIIYSLEL